MRARPTTTVVARYATPERREVQQIGFPNVEEARAAAAEDRERHDLRADRSRARHQGHRHQSRPRDEVGHARSARSRTRLSHSQPGQVSEPVPGASGQSFCASARSNPKKFGPTKRSPTTSSATSRRTAPGKRSRICTIKIEDERGAGQSLADIAKKLNLSMRTIDAIDRSGRDPKGDLVTGIPTNADFLGRRLRIRHRRRKRAGADAGRRHHLVRRVVHHPFARTPARRSPGSCERTLARRRDRRASQGKSERAAEKLKTSTVAEVAAARRAKVAECQGLEARRGVRCRAGQASSMTSSRRRKTASEIPKAIARPIALCSVSPTSSAPPLDPTRPKPSSSTMRCKTAYSKIWSPVYHASASRSRHHHQRGCR